MRRSNSVSRSFSALAALIRFSYSRAQLFSCSDVYPSFAADGCIFQLESLARSLRDTCVEKGYLLALVDLGRAAFIAAAVPKQGDDGTNLRAELLEAISLQRYVSSPPTQSCLILFLQGAQRRLYCFCWQSVHCLRKSIRFPPLAPSLSKILLHH